jgi:hypothetical protein
MTHVDKINVDVTTRNVTNAGTNGEVYLGYGGREFRLDQPGDQFKKGANDHFTIGVGSDIEDKNINDLPLNPSTSPDSPKINENIVLGTNPFPVYIRLDPKDDDDNDWNVETVQVAAVAGGGIGTGTTKTYVFPKAGGTHLAGTIWLGRRSGLTLFLEQQP